MEYFRAQPMAASSRLVTKPASPVNSFPDIFHAGHVGFSPGPEPVQKSVVVQAFRPAVSGGPEGPHYTRTGFFTGSKGLRYKTPPILIANPARHCPRRRRSLP